MDTAAFEAYLAKVAEPLSGAPCGEDLKRDDDYGRVVDEVKGKLGTPLAGEIDWQMAARVGSTILTTRSKDVVLATYTALAMFRVERYPGLAKGLGTIRVFAERWWEDCFPPAKRMRARTGALEWFFERLEAELNEDPASPRDREALLVCLDEIKKMNGHFRAALGGEAPSTRRPRDVMEARLAELPAPQAAPPPPPPPPPRPAEPEPEEAPAEWEEPAAQAPAPPPVAPPPEPAPRAPEPAPAAPPPPAAAAAPAPRVSVPPPPSASGPPAEVLKDLRRTFSGLGQAAVALRAATPLDPLPYALSRIAAWTLLTGAPPAKDGATVIPDPNKAEIQHFEALAAAEDWSELVQKAEARFVTGPLWLDLQAHVARGLKALGPSARGARAVVVGSLRDLVERIPELLDLSFKGGTPFASDATRQWIDAEVRGAPPAAGGGIPLAAPAAGDGALAELASLIGAAASVPELAAAQARVDALPRQADRFRGQLLIADACLRMDHPAHAASLLRGLYQIAARHDLAAWDPSAQADLLELLIRAKMKLPKGGEDDGLPLASLISALCSVDIGRALRYRYPG